VSDTTKLNRITKQANKMYLFFLSPAEE